MMRFGIGAALSGALLLTTGAAMAQPPGPGPGGGGPQDVVEADDRGFYFGIGIEQFRVEAEGESGGTSYDISTRPLGISGRLGYNLMEWLSVEAHASTGIHDDPNSGDVGGAGAVRDGETELKYHVGAAISPEYQFFVGDQTTIVTVFGLLGYNQFEFEGELDSSRSGTPQAVSYTLDDGSEYFGGGVQLDAGVASLRLQYTRYFSDSDVSVDGILFGLSYYF